MVIESTLVSETVAGTSPLPAATIARVEFDDEAAPHLVVVKSPHLTALALFAKTITSILDDGGYGLSPAPPLIIPRVADPHALTTYLG